MGPPPNEGALLERRVDFAVHSLEDLETELPPGIVLACTLKREDNRDALVLGPECAAVTAETPWACLPHGALVGSASVRRQAQLLHARPDLRVDRSTATCRHGSPRWPAGASAPRCWRWQGCGGQDSRQRRGW